MSPGAWILLGTAAAALTLWAWRTWERGEIERSYQQRQRELADQDAAAKTIRPGPQLLTEEDIVRRASKKP